MEGGEPEGREEGNLEALWFLPPAPRICEAEGRKAKGRDEITNARALAEAARS